jgi:pyruvate dehydrogenase E1 component alpha subunit
MTTATQRQQTPAVDSSAAREGEGDIDRETLLDMLRRMMLIRRFEERTMQAYQQAKIGGFCHIYIGQEACAVGSITALRHEDPIVTAYRDHGHALARGMDPRYAMAEMYGKVTGCAKGKGGSMHFFDKPNHMYGGHAIVGGQCPLGVGLAWAIQYEQKDNVALCYLGDGALNQGAFHEAMNLASIWNLPIIFVLENNMYSMGTHIARGTSMAGDLAVKAESYGMRFAECDGLDVIDVYSTFRREVANTRDAKNPQWERGAIPEYRREGQTPGPCFCVVHTYRYQGHSMSDPQKYRTKDEVASRQERDPINTLVNHLVEKKLATQEEVETMDSEAKELAKESVKYAEESPELGKDELYTDVYANPYGPYTNPGPSIFMQETGNA